MRTMSAALTFLMMTGSTAAFADWTLDGEKSSLYYVTSKAAAVSEVNSFAGLSGSITANGVATLTIALETVDTAIDIRNERMRDIVFKVTEYPQATITLQVDTAALDAMTPGVSSKGAYVASVNLHGVTQEINAELEVLKSDADTLQIWLAKPLIVGSATFGLLEGVEQLKEIAGLPSINPNVVVDFTLVYNRD
jgi:polyisoprenoid-binding protein YceI